MSSSSTPKIIASAIGRRKTAIASVRVISGNGQITVNGRSAEDYFPGQILKSRYARPLNILSLTKYSAVVRVAGGGLPAQADAVVLGLSRALVKIKSDHKTSLRSAGLLTRDPRRRQRRMVGTGGKARRRKQSPKR